MTPQEKAKELVERFSRFTEPSDCKHEAIQCAIITVNEILDLGYAPKEKSSFRIYEFYSNVKIELENGKRIIL